MMFVDPVPAPLAVDGFKVKVMCNSTHYTTWPPDMSSSSVVYCVGGLWTSVGITCKGKLVFDAAIEWD